MKPLQHTVTSVIRKSSIVWVRTNPPFSKIFRGNLEEICQDLEIFAHASLPYDALWKLSREPRKSIFFHVTNLHETQSRAGRPKMVGDVGSYSAGTTALEPSTPNTQENEVRKWLTCICERLHFSITFTKCTKKLWGCNHISIHGTRVFSVDSEQVVSAPVVTYAHRHTLGNICELRKCAVPEIIGKSTITQGRFPNIKFLFLHARHVRWIPNVTAHHTLNAEASKVDIWGAFPQQIIVGRAILVKIVNRVTNLQVGKQGSLIITSHKWRFLSVHESFPWNVTCLLSAKNHTRHWLSP